MSINNGVKFEKILFFYLEFQSTKETPKSVEEKWHKSTAHQILEKSQA